MTMNVEDIEKQIEQSEKIKPLISDLKKLVAEINKLVEKVRVVVPDFISPLEPAPLPQLCRGDVSNMILNFLSADVAHRKFRKDFIKQFPDTLPNTIDSAVNRMVANGIIKEIRLDEDTYRSFIRA